MESNISSKISLFISNISLAFPRLIRLWRSKFFEHAAFYGGTALLILYQLDRFSEDMNFSLLKPNNQFKLDYYLKALKREIESFGFSISVEIREKKPESAIESAFLKGGTKAAIWQVAKL